MKKLLSMIVFMAFAISVFAQDIIVKKDGSTIQAKVEKVTSTEVEYKKASNPDGPTYTVSIADLISINYQNGSSDVFTPNTPKLNSTTNNGYVTDETVSRYSNDQQLLRQYQIDKYESYRKKAKVWKMTGLIGGSVMIVTGAILILKNCYYWSWDIYEDGYGNIFDERIKVYDYGRDGCSVGFGLAGFGLACGAVCYLIGNNYSKKASASKALIGFEHSFDNGSNLSVGLDVMGTYYNPGIGVGVCYNF